MDKRICVVGGGRWGSNHLKTLNSLGCLAGLVESNDIARKTHSETYPDIKTFRTIQEAVEEGFDGYTVATPAETHYDIAKFIIENDRSVLVEKPLALTSTEAKKLKSLAESKGVNLMVGHVMLFHPAIRKMKELIDSDKIGKPQYLYSNRLNLGTVRKEENILWSFAPHDISIFQYFLDDSEPVEVVSRGGAFVQPHIHDTTMTTFTYPDNVRAHTFVSWLHPFKEHRVVVIGTKGMLSYDDSSKEKEVLFYEKGIDFVKGEPIKRDGATEAIQYDQAMPLTEELRYFVEKIDNGKVEIAGPNNAIAVLSVLERASESLSEIDTTESDKPAEQKFFVHESSYVDDNVEIGDGTKIWHFSHVQPNSQIGKKCSIGQNVNIANNVKVGDFVKIQNNVSVYEGVELEDYVFCGPSMVFTNITDPRSKYPQATSNCYKKTLVKTGASIGANATIVCGHTVGKHSFVAAGAVVSKDVPDYAMVMGVPAKRVAWMSEAGEKLNFDSNGQAKCSRTGMEYKLDGEVVTCVSESGQQKQASAA